VAVRTAANELRVRCTVADNGPGVPAAERGLLFTEHAQLSNRPTGGEESTGLGLSIVKQLIEGDGGRVGADFPAEGGAEFWFELPIAPGM
jgi:signal transduction histidine kinase